MADNANPHTKKSVVVPILLITVGFGWLLTAQEVIPGVNWVWVLGLGIVGVLTFALGGVNKFTVVVGPFLIVCTIFSLLRQTGRMSIDTEIPALVILAGFLLLIVQFLRIPLPNWLVTPPSNRNRK